MIAIFDYGAGNLRSVENTLDALHVPKPAAFSVWTSMHEALRIKAHFLEQEFTGRVLVIVRRNNFLWRFFSLRERQEIPHNKTKLRYDVFGFASGVTVE